MRNPFAFASYPSWNRVFVDQSKEGQASVYRDPAFRNAFRQELKRPMGFGNWDRGALKGEYLVLREWRNGTSVEHVA